MTDPLAVGIVTGTIALVGALGGQYIAYRRQLLSERANAARTLRDAKRERLRNVYRTVLNAAREYKAYVHELDVLWEGEDEETRNNRLASSLAKTLAPMNDAMVDLTLENAGQDVENCFIELRNAAGSYASKLRYNHEYHQVGYSPFPNVHEEQEKVDRLTAELTRLMQAHLADLERPDLPSAGKRMRLIAWIANHRPGRNPRK